MTGPDFEAIGKDKEAKKRLVIDSIAAQCNNLHSTFGDLSVIHSALQKGDVLEADILTGGLANYTYKVYLSQSPYIALFAKLTFNYIQILPDDPCPLNRTDNEYRMMQKFQSLAPGRVAIPYFCIDVNDCKLLVTQWSPADEQFGNQFIDGRVDTRLAKILANCLSALHCSEFDPTFNEDMKPYFKSLQPVMTSMVDGFFEPDRVDDRVSRLAKDVNQFGGREKCDIIFANYQKELDVQSSLVHGDFHVFNIMAGKKPITTDNIENAADDEPPTIVICDWEMTLAGPCGTDLGAFSAFPLACALAHSLNGDKDASDNILNFLDIIWEEYAGIMMEKGGKSYEEMAGVFRECLGRIGIYAAVVYYNLGAHMDFLPFDDDNVEDLTTVKEALGCLGLNFMSWAFTDDGGDMNLEDLRLMFKAAVDEEVANLYAAKVPNSRARKRRSSLLRASGRRVSDSALHFGNMDRLSFVSAEGNLLEEPESCPVVMTPQ